MVGNLKKMGPSNLVFKQAYNSNPQFRQFADSMSKLGPEEAFRQNGLDYNQFKHLKW